MTGLTVKLTAKYTIFISQKEIRSFLDIPIHKNVTAHNAAIELAQNKLKCDGLNPDETKVVEVN